MSTIDSKEIIQDIMDGKYQEDNIQYIGTYINSFGNEVYKIFYGENAKATLLEFLSDNNPFVKSPSLLWEKNKGLAEDAIFIRTS